MSYPSQRINLTEPPPRLTAEQVAERYWLAFPEAAGPAQEHESGEILRGDRITAHARVGPIPRPSGFTAEMRDRENAERERRWAAMSDGERALAEAEALRGQGGRRF